MVGFGEVVAVLNVQFAAMVQLALGNFDSSRDIADLGLSGCLDSGNIRCFSIQRLLR